MDNSSRRSHGLFGSTETDRGLFRAQIGDNSYGIDATREYESSFAGLSPDHLPASKNSLSLFENLEDTSAGMANWELEIYQMQSYEPFSLNHKLYNTYNTQRLDAIDQAMLEPASLLSNSTYSSDNQLDQQSDTPPLVKRDQSRMMMNPGPGLSLQKGKSSIGSSINAVQDAKLLNGEIVLWLLFKYISRPTMEDIENIANDTGYSFEFVIDSYCQYRKGCRTDHVASIKPALISQSVPRARALHTRGSGDTTDSAYGTQIEEPPVENTQPPNKRVRLDGISTVVPEQSPANNLLATPCRCRQCNKVFNRQSDLRRHLKTHALGELQCPYNGCGKIFSRKDKLNDHWRRWHTDNAFKAKTSIPADDDPDRDPDSNGQPDKNNSFGGTRHPPNSKNTANSSSSAASNHRTSFRDGYMFSRGFMGGDLHLQCKPFAAFKSELSAWRVIRKLGYGGFGSVYEVSIGHGMGSKDRTLVATKIIQIPRDRRNEALQRAQNEISILRLLDHRHIIKLAGAYALADRIFINTLPVADCNLTQFLSRQSHPISIVDQMKLLEEAGKVASALAHIHNYNIDVGYKGWHLDIKPDNILVTLDASSRSLSRFLICDFGSANILNSTSNVIHKTRAVTPRYSAPELAKGEIGQRADIWSFGCVLAEIFTFLHDKSMQDFEIFASNSVDFKQNWSYSDVLPVLIDWLKSLSSTGARLPCLMFRDDYINLIMEMLQLSPHERPSATDVVKRLQKIDRNGTRERTMNLDACTGKHSVQEDGTFITSPISVLHESKLPGSFYGIGNLLEPLIIRNTALNSHSDSGLDVYKPKRNHRDHRLQVLYEPSSNIPTIDVVALYDNLSDTWIPEKSEPSTWLKHLLSNATPMARILTFIYDSTPTFPLTEGKVDNGIKDEAQCLLKCLKELREGHETKPVVFICQSLVEPVLNEALLCALNDPYFSSLFKATSRVVVLESPHRGSIGKTLALPSELFGSFQLESELDSSLKGGPVLTLDSFLSSETDSETLVPVDNDKHLSIMGISRTLVPIMGDYISKLTTVLRKVTGFSSKDYHDQESEVFGNSPVILAEHSIKLHYSYPSLKRSYQRSTQALYSEIALGSQEAVLRTNNQREPIIYPENGLLSLCQAPAQHTILNQHGKHSEIEITAQMHGMFFLSETRKNYDLAAAVQPTLTCYRRNLISISGSVTSPTGPISVVTEKVKTVPVVFQELSISAIESIDAHIVKLIVVPWKPPLPDSAEALLNQEPEPQPITLESNADTITDNDVTAQTVLWRRLQFRIATANNGRRNELQQHFVLQMNLMATLADNTKLCIARATSAPIVVRGRSPRNFQVRKEIPPIMSSASPQGRAAEGSYAGKKRPFQYCSSNFPPPTRPWRGEFQASRERVDIGTARNGDKEGSALDIARRQIKKALTVGSPTAEREVGYGDRSGIGDVRSRRQIKSSVGFEEESWSEKIIKAN